MEIDGAEDTTLQALEAISTLIPTLAETPLSYSLHYQHIALAEATGMSDQLKAARKTLTTYLAATEDVWLPVLDYAIEDISANGSNIESYLELEGLFALAERDYLSIPILKRHIEFLIQQAGRVEDPEFSAVYGFPEMYEHEVTATRAWNTVAKANRHLSKSHELWDMCMEWEQTRAGNLKGQERSKRVEFLQEAYLSRLAVPHLTHAETYQNYSTFVSAFLPADAYEDALINATAARQEAVKVVSEREQFESSLTSLHSYGPYITWESEPKRPKQYRQKGRKQQKPDAIPPDPQLVTALYERAIAEAASQRANVLKSTGGANESADALAAAEAWLASFWDGLTSFLRENARDQDIELEILQRAGRSVPSDGRIIASHIRALDFHGSGGEDDVQSVTEAYDQAFASGVLDVAAVTRVAMARVGYELHRLGAEDPDIAAFQRLTDALEAAIEKSREMGGDDTLKMEKALVHTLVTFGDMTDEAIQVWEKTVKFHKNKYFAWTEYAAFVTLQVRDMDKARKVFKDAATPSRNLDYPQALWSAWIAFEELHGSVEHLEHAMKRVRKMTADFAANTAKAAEQMEVVQQPAEMPVMQVMPDSGMMVVDEAPAASSASHKRKVDDDDEPLEQPAKRNKPDVDEPLKRDRENSTVFVTGLWAGLQDEELKNLFKDCGAVREVKITTLPHDVVATVELMDRENVPAALTKDKKRIQGNEVAVFLAWQSTLYITNFPEKTDDAAIRELFGKYGVVFDVRWPSKKFKSTRRFCYVQYTSPSSAKAALELNGKELEAGMAMNVYLSNPQRKKERTDAGVSQREIYVAGIAKNTTQKELEELFSECGPIKGVRVPLDDRGKAKGFAFIEFEHETSALSALAYNNREVKKRRIAVTMVDPRAPARKQQEPSSGFGKKADVASRSVRIKGLPAGTEEGLLQQSIEKVAQGIKKVEIFQDVWEALVEFESMADAAKLLLTGEKLTFQGVQLKIADESQSKPNQGPAARTSTKPSMPSSSFVPRAAAKPKARFALGHKGAPAHKEPNGASASGSTVPQVGAAPSVKDQDMFRAMLSGGK